MNPWNLSATELLVWGLVAHAVADWLLQSAWMADNKAKRRGRVVYRTTPGRKLSAEEIAAQAGSFKINEYGPAHSITRETRWWDRHPAAFVHAGIHGALLAFIFGWVAAPLALIHLSIDTRVPVAMLSAFMGQTVPENQSVEVGWRFEGQRKGGQKATRISVRAPYYGIGQEVRIWADQVWHLATLAVAALIVVAT